MDRPSGATTGSVSRATTWRRRAASWRAGGLSLIALCLALYLPGLWSIPPVDRDESRFAQASYQMLASGTLEGWVVPRIQEKPRLNKPPLIYWLQATSAWLSGVERKNPKRERAGSTAALPTAGIWAYRMPSVLCAVISVLLTWRLGLRMFDPRAAWLGAALLGACVMQLWDARQARADQLLLTITLGAQLTLFGLWRHRARPDRLTLARIALFWSLIGLGVMSKGPITPLVSGLTALSLAAATGEWRWLLRLRPILGLIIVAAIIAPWAALVMREVGAANYLSIVYDETLGRSTSAKEGHWGPPGYHTVMLAVMFWPGSLLTLAAMVRAGRKARGVRSVINPEHAQGGAREEQPDPVRNRALRSLRLRGRAPEIFLLCWIIPAWIIFELIGTKLPHYTLPMYPAIALLTARAVFAAETGRLRGATSFGSKLGWIVWLVIGAAMGVAAPIAMLSMGALPTEGTPAAIALAAMCGVLLVIALINLHASRFIAAHAASLGATLLSSAILFHTLLPAVQSVWLSARVMREIARVDPAGICPLAAFGYAEDSLVFMTRGNISRVAPAELDAWRTRNPDGLVVWRVGPDTQINVESRPPLATIHGYNYANGELTTLNILGRM